MKIFVTGSSGAVGKYVIPRILANGHEVCVLARDPRSIVELFGALPNLLIVDGDLSAIFEWRRALSEFNPDAALHLAWEGIPDFSTPQSIKNLEYSLELFDALGKAGCEKLVVPGTCAEYGDGNGPMSENFVVDPGASAPKHNFGNNLGVYKHALHLLGTQIAKEHGMQFTWARLFFVYGPNQRSGALIPSLIRKVKNGERLELKTPDSSQDFVYVDDAASALQMLIEKDVPGNAVYNVGSGKITSVRYIAKRIYSHYGHDDWANEMGNDPSVLSGFCADVSKIQREIGWKPTVTMDEGIRRMVSESQT